MDWQLIVGTLSGFIVAFAAEPVKTFFQRKAELEKLRTALFKEMTLNYAIINVQFRGNEKEKNLSRMFVIYNGINTQCYDHILEKDPLLFHQLQESMYIALVNENIKLAKALELEEEDVDRFYSTIRQASREIKKLVEVGVFPKYIKTGLSLSGKLLRAHESEEKGAA